MKTFNNAPNFEINFNELNFFIYKNQFAINLLTSLR